MSESTQYELLHFVKRLQEFSRLSNEDRLMFFDIVSPKICSEEWRKKFRKFLQKEKTGEYTDIIDDFFTHTQLYVTDPDKVTACHACREAFLKLVFLSTIG